MQPERRVRPKVEERVGGANCQRTFPSILANAKNLRGFGGLVPHALTNSYPFSNFTFWNSRDHTALQFTLNQNSSTSVKVSGLATTFVVVSSLTLSR